MLTIPISRRLDWLFNIKIYQVSFGETVICSTFTFFCHQALKSIKFSLVIVQLSAYIYAVKIVNVVGFICSQFIKLMFSMHLNTSNHELHYLKNPTRPVLWVYILFWLDKVVNYYLVQICACCPVSTKPVKCLFISTIFSLRIRLWIRHQFLLPLCFHSTYLALY